MTEFRSLVELASDAALAIGANARVVAWNERAATLLGYTPDQVLGRPCYEILQPRFPSGEPVCMPRCNGELCFMQHPPFAIRDCSLRHRNGDLLQASISTLAAPDSDSDEARSPTLALVFLRLREDVMARASTGERMRISTFGRFGLSVADHALPVDRWHRKHALTLLKILVAHHEGVHREQLIEYLWAEADEHKARDRLKVTLHYLRQQIRSAGAHDDVIALVNATYALKRDAIWLDNQAFETLANEGRVLNRRGQSKDALSCFEQAERLYEGDFLPEERYADWCVAERERLREIYFDVIGHLIEGYLECGDYERAAEVCRLGLAREPCQERFHRALMICLSRLGQSDRVIACHDRFRRMLKSELEVEPTPETERLYRELLAEGKIG